MSIQANQNKDTKPVIFLAFANPMAGTQGFLHNLGEEVRQLETVIRQAEVNKLCTLVIKPYAGLTEIVEVFQEYRNRIAIFHYAGHAQNFMLLLEDSGGDKRTDMGDNRGTTMIDGRGLATFLGEQSGLQLVFLNACSTQPQVQELLNANVPAVIATSQAIRDDVATVLATHFYQSLTSGANLQKAFNEAEGLVQALVGKDTVGGGSVRDAYFEDDAGVAMTEFYHWPWSLTINPGAEQVSEWSLADAAKEPLFGLPSLPEHDLPESPFRHLNFFTEQDAEIFFGRGHQIRILYDLVTTPHSAPLILFYGESGVGKSSMLAAGLRPRLQQQAIHYVRREQNLGLTGTLAQVLWDGEPTPDVVDPETITNRWHELEQTSDRTNIQPLVIILDQVEETFTRPNRQHPHELADFLTVLSALFAHRSYRPQGKLILGFRKEWLADIEDAIKTQRLQRTKLFLSRLNRADIIEAVTGVVRSTRLQTHYRLTIEPGLAEIIADDMLEDPDSPIAPTLQILLTKMWAEAERINLDQPHFDIALYQSLKREGLLLRDFLNQQLDTLHQWCAEIVDSGLVLDVLAAHTTPQGTVDYHTEAELLEMYRHLERDIPPLVQKCEELYLLFNPVKQQADQPKSSRLVHDALAPLTRQQYDESDRPGQRARRILDSRIVEWMDKQGHPTEGNPLDETDLRLVESGLKGTRHLTPLEQRLLEASRLAQIQREQERKQQRLMLEAQNLASQSQLLVQVEKDQSDLPLILARDAVMANLNANTSRVLRIALEGHPFISRQSIFSANLHHQGTVWSVAYHPDGQTIASAGADGTIRIWRADDLTPISLLFGHAGQVYAISYSRDGTHIVSASADQTVRMWNVSSGEQVAQFDGHSDEVVSVAYSPDETHIVSGSKDSTVRVWEVASGQQVMKFDGHSNWINSASYSPDGTHIVSGSHDNTVRIWSVASGKQVMQFNGHSNWVRAVGYSPDGTHIVSGSADQTVRIWHIAGKKQVMELSGHSAWVLSVSYSPDGVHIISSSADKTVRIWDVSSGQQVSRFDGHSGYVSSVSYSPDRRYIVTGSYDNTIQIWDIANREPIASLEAHTSEMGIKSHDTKNIPKKFLDDNKTEYILNDPNQTKATNFKRSIDRILSVSYSPDGLHLVSGGRDKKVRIWEVASREQVAQFDGHSDVIVSVSYSLDGTHIVSGSYDNTVCIWEVASGEQIAQLNEHLGTVNSVSYSPNGRHVVSGSDDGTVRIWEVASGKQVVQFDGHSAWIESVAYSPSGTHVVSGSSDKTVRIWEVASGKQVARFEGHSSSINAVLFSPGETHVVSGSFDNTVRIWDIASGEQVAQLDGHMSGVTSVSYSLDGTHIASGSFDKTIRIWDVTSGQQVAQLDGHLDGIGSLSYSPDGTHIVSTSRDTTIRIWNIASREQVAQFGGNPTHSVSYSPDGIHVVSGSLDNTVRIWDVTSGQQMTQLNGHSNRVLSVSYGSDGKYITSGSNDNTIRIWKAANGEQVTQFDGHTGLVNAVSYSPDGRHIASTGDDTAIRIWDVTSGQQVAQFYGHSDVVNAVSYSPDGTHIVSGSHDNSVRIWAVASGQQVKQLHGHSDFVLSVSYSPNGLSIVSGGADATVRIWEVASGKQVTQLNGHSKEVNSASYSPDGIYIISGSSDHTIRIWEVVSRKQVTQFDGHSKEVNSVSYSPDGTHIVSGSNDNTIRIWETPQSMLLRCVAQILRPAPILTSKERQRFGIGKDVMLPDQTRLKPLMAEARAYMLIKEGRALARAGDILNAMPKFEEALAMTAHLDKEALTLPCLFDFEPAQEAIRWARVGKEQ
ncbi:MAG: CHAT domain-containing protein [Chloroflexota bacterium]